MDSSPVSQPSYEFHGSSYSFRTDFRRTADRSFARLSVVELAFGKRWVNSQLQRCLLHWLKIRSQRSLLNAVLNGYRRKRFRNGANSSLNIGAIHGCASEGDLLQKLKISPQIPVKKHEATGDISSVKLGSNGWRKNASRSVNIV